MNALEQLRSMTVVVADTGDFEAMRALKPQDATTNPSLITKAAALPAYADLVKATQRGVNADSRLAGRPEALIDRLAVAFGCEILKIVPGRVSTEVDARLSFDTAATVSRARGLMDLYRQARIDPNRVLIKIAATWEGIRAAEILEKEGIHCNLTLLFSLPQAIACAEAGVTLISPFVGRILDWHKAARKVDHIPAEEDPGVLSVRDIYAYYKAHGYPTEVMGASFRNKEEILALAGCDLLTISPELLKELESLEAPVPRQLSAPSKPGLAQARPARMTEAQFRWQLNEDPMATEKLAQGIRAFAADLVKLEGLLA